MNEPSFVSVYRRFYGLIAQPAPLASAAAARASVDPGASPLGGWILAESEEQATSRLGIYAHMYFARLRDSLREDYPSCVTLMGDDSFARVAARYLMEHPSDNPSLRHHGRHFAGFLRRRRELLESLVGPLRADLPELAELEWARIEVFDAPHAQPLVPAALERLPVADWPELGLKLVPAQRLVEQQFAVEGAWRAAELGHAAEAPKAERTTLLVWRRGFVSRHRSLAKDEARALRLLESGARFADLCEVLAVELDPQAGARRAVELLRQWLVDELLLVAC
jgi:hypothetical protein